MNEQLKQVLSMAYLIWNKHWLVFGLTAAICVVGWPVVHFMPDVYESKVKIYLDTQSVLRPLLEGLAVDDEDAEEKMLDVARRTLLSRTNIEAVAKDVDLDLHASSPEEFEKILQRLRMDIRVEGSERENIYQISYRDADPRMAKRIVESLLNTFMESLLKTSRGDTELAHKFLESQIAVYEKKLVEAEDALKAFKRENIGLMPTESGGYFRQMERADADLAEARLELREAMKRRNDLRDQLEKEKKSIEARAGQTSTGSSGDSVLDERLRNMETRLDELLLSYTDSHPDVISLKENIAQLKKERKRLMEEAPEKALESLHTSDPVYQELRIELSRSEAEVSGLQVRVDEYKRKVEKLKELIDTIPMVEAGLAKLNRDYNVNKENYEALVSRREAAVISREAELSSDMVHVRVIDPPLEPVIPVAPNRPLLLIAVLGGALGVSFGLILLDIQLRPRFISLESLRATTGYPVIGGVSLHMSPSDQRAKKIKLGVFFSLLAGFFVLFLLVVTFEAGLFT